MLKFTLQGRSSSIFFLLPLVMSMTMRISAFRAASSWPSTLGLRHSTSMTRPKRIMNPISPRSFQTSGVKMVAVDIELRLQEKNIVLPEAAPPAANYVPYVVSGNYVYVAGQIPMINGELHYKGKVPTDFSIEEGYKCARLCGLNILAQVKAACGGDLRKVKHVVKLVGFVNCPPDFYDIPKVINGASDLMVEVFGEAGRHARSAVGSVALPLNVATEVEAVIELEDTFSEYGPGSAAAGVDRRGRATAFAAGMKVEVLDRKFRDVITVGTIKDVQGSTVRIGFDGWDDSYDFECSINDGDFQPPGTCLRAGARLSPPNGYRGFFDWGSYLQETDSTAAPPQVFKSATVFPSFKGDVAIKFEMWHRNEATVVPVPPTPQEQEQQNRQKTFKKP